MPFDARRWPNAMTIADLMKDGLLMGVHCHPCGRHVVVDPATLPLAPELPVPSLGKAVQVFALRIALDRRRAGVAGAEL